MKNFLLTGSKVGRGFNGPRGNEREGRSPNSPPPPPLPTFGAAPMGARAGFFNEEPTERELGSYKNTSTCKYIIIIILKSLCAYLHVHVHNEHDALNQFVNVHALTSIILQNNFNY